MSFISTPEQLSETIKELTPFQWATPEVCSKLTTGEFSYISVLVSKFGAENKIRDILERANLRK